MYWVQSRQQYGHTLHHGSPGQFSSLPGDLCLCPSPTRGHPPCYSHKGPVSMWILSHGSHDPPSVTPKLSESQILILTVLYMSSWLVPRPSLSHPFHTPAPQPSQPQPLWSWVLLKHSDTFLEASAQNLLITEHFPDPCQPPLSPSLSFFTMLIITWHRILPNFIVCSLPLLCVYYFTIFCL